MSIKTNFKKTTQGDGDTERKLVQLEKNVQDALDNVIQQAWTRLVPTNLKTSAYSGMLDELVVCNGTFTVTLPTANAQNRGRCVGIEVKAGTISVIAFSGLVQGVARDSILAKGYFLYVSDGVGWYRPGGVSSITAGAGLTVGGVAGATGTGAVTVAADTTSLVTLAALNTAVSSVRFEMEKLRVLMMQLAKIQMGLPLDVGVEGLS